MPPTLYTLTSPSSGVIHQNQMGLDQGIYPWHSKDMPRVTSKLQVTIPKAIAETYGIRPGSEIRWVPAGEVIRVEPPSLQPRPQLSPEKRLALFDQMTKRIERLSPVKPAPTGAKREWRREDLYADRLGRYARSR
jgi:AbrB family looped-hinge helix DNA binding protein